MTEVLHTTNFESSLDSESGNDVGELDDWAEMYTVIDDEGDQEDDPVLNLFYVHDKLWRVLSFEMLLKNMLP
jgi:hypothetical protein